MISQPKKRKPRSDVMTSAFSGENKLFGVGTLLQFWMRIWLKTRKQKRKKRPWQETQNYISNQKINFIL